MRSPLYPFRQKQLANLFSQGVIKAMWKKKVQKMALREFIFSYTGRVLKYFKKELLKART